MREARLLHLPPPSHASAWSQPEGTPLQVPANIKNQHMLVADVSNRVNMIVDLMEEFDTAAYKVLRMLPPIFSHAKKLELSKSVQSSNEIHYQIKDKLRGLGHSLLQNNVRKLSTGDEVRELTRNVVNGAAIMGTPAWIANRRLG